MISGRRAKRSAILGLTLVFATVMLFMQVFPDQKGLHWTSLFFIVLGEALPITTYVWLEERHARAMSSGLRAGVYTLLFIYGLTAISMTVTLLVLGVSAGLLATLGSVLALAFGAILLFAMAIGGDKSRSRAYALEATAFMRALEQDVSTLAFAPVNQIYHEQLRQIEEGIKYSDYSGLTELDAALAEKVRELTYVLREDRQSERAISYKPGDLSEADREKQVDLLTTDLLQLLQSRNRALLNQKKERNYANG